MTIYVDTYENGDWHENCYLVSNKKHELLILDPGSCPDSIVAIIEKNNWIPLAIINTHAHYDHIGAVAELMKNYDIPFYLHGDDLRLLKRANTYSFLFGSNTAVKIPKVTYNLNEFDTIFKIGSFRIKWLATPGHTDGSVCLIIGKHCFTGDTLFASTYGRTDLPGGNSKKLKVSIELLNGLDQSLTIHPGHGNPSILASALQSSSFNSKVKK